MDDRLNVGHILRAAAVPPLEDGIEPIYIAWLAPEALPTDDGRIMDPGSLRWREGALPLMASDQNLPMHLTAVLIANLVEFERREDEAGITWVVARALFDSDPEAQEFRRMVDCEADEDGCVQMRGVSIDLSVQDATVREDPAVDEDPEALQQAEDDEEEEWPENVWLRVHDGIIVGATLVPMPAFAEARIEPALVAASFPVRPPAPWFMMPDHDGPVPWT
ncbi:MAG: hypothetical protein M3537_08170, partial [Chloroflexota bacterium]|nr:hypothetical protein [Chloroflexota bacterium]